MMVNKSFKKRARSNHESLQVIGGMQMHIAFFVLQNHRIVRWFSRALAVNKKILLC